jgi:hypothetical protein
VREPNARVVVLGDKPGVFRNIHEKSISFIVQPKKYSLREIFTSFSNGTPS